MLQEQQVFEPAVKDSKVGLSIQIKKLKWKHSVFDVIQEFRYLFLRNKSIIPIYHYRAMPQLLDLKSLYSCIQKELDKTLFANHETHNWWDSPEIR